MRFSAPNFYGNNTPSTSDISAAVSDSLNDMEIDLNVSRISLPNNDSLIDTLMDEAPNLSGIIDPEL